MNQEFQLAKLIFDSSKTFADKKNIVVGLIVANIKNAEQRDHWLTVLNQLIAYEQQFFYKLQQVNFDQQLIININNLISLDQTLDHIINA